MGRFNCISFVSYNHYKTKKNTRVSEYGLTTNEHLYVYTFCTLMRLFYFILVTDASTLQRYYARFDERFFQFCDKELSKINTFFYGLLLTIPYTCMYTHCEVTMTNIKN